MIKHQQQPTSTSCVSTCIAMILDIPVEQVIKEFHKPYMAHEIDTHQYLENFGVTANPLLSTHKPWEDKLYILSVPSLNIEARMHSIIADSRTGFTEIFDPNMGREGRKYYVWNNKEELKDLEVNIHGYYFEYEIQES